MLSFHASSNYCKQAHILDTVALTLVHSLELSISTDTWGTHSTQRPESYRYLVPTISMMPLSQSHGKWVNDSVRQTRSQFLRPEISLGAGGPVPITIPPSTICTAF